MTPDSASDVFASDAEGRRYRTGVFDPIDEAALTKAPDQGRFPVRGTGPAFHRVGELPRVPRVRHLIGPSIIAAGMGLGAGEFLLWPNLITVNGYSIWWLFWIGVMTQFLVMGEIERWTIAFWTQQRTFVLFLTVLVPAAMAIIAAGWPPPHGSAGGMLWAAILWGWFAVRVVLPRAGRAS